MRAAPFDKSRRDYQRATYEQRQVLDRSADMTNDSVHEETGFELPELTYVRVLKRTRQFELTSFVLQVFELVSGWEAAMREKGHGISPLHPRDPTSLHYITMKQHHMYLQKAHCKALSIHNTKYTAECNKSFYEKKVRKNLLRIGTVLGELRPQIIRPRDRFEGFVGLWNHVEIFPFQHTWMPDGYPLVWWKPKKWLIDIKEDPVARRLLGWSDDEVDAGRFGARYLVNTGKYCECMIRGFVINAFHGVILLQTLELGVDNDHRTAEELIEQEDWVLEDWEWGLGDKAFIAIERVLAGIKPERSHFDSFWNKIISHYRARGEIVIAKLKSHGWCKTAFRGRWKSLVAYNEIATVTTALEIKRKLHEGKPMFEVVGPWEHDKTP